MSGDFEFEKPKRGRPAKGEVEVEKPVVEETASEKKDDNEPEKKEYDKDELLRIFDEIIFTGEYTEEMTIKGKLKVHFRTRTAEEISDISRLLDTTHYNLVATLNESRLLLNLQYALIGYQGRNLGVMKNEERAAFVKKLPGPVIGMLVEALYEFDNKVSEACKEVEENF
jgi:hypothetical protein